MNTAGLSFSTRLATLLTLLFLLQAWPAYAQEEQPAPKEPEQALMDNSLSSLVSLKTLQARLEFDIQKKRQEFKAAQTDVEKKAIQSQLDELQADLDATRGNFEKIAAGAGLDSLRAKEEKPFHFTDELFALIKPAINEMKAMTSGVRQKAELKDKITYYTERLPLAEKGVAGIQQLLTETDDKSVGRSYAHCWMPGRSNTPSFRTSCKPPSCSSTNWPAGRHLWPRPPATTLNPSSRNAACT